jgi:hypothetical protein
MLSRRGFAGSLMSCFFSGFHSRVGFDFCRLEVGAAFFAGAALPSEPPLPG